MSNPPTLSVIMSNYNDAKTLPRAIEAIVTQSRIPDEFLIVDDGSTDESVNIIKSYIEKYSWIVLYQNEKNMGIQYSVNKLLKLTKADFFYGASANDYILPGFFEKGMRLAEKYPDAGVIVGEIISQDKNGNNLGIAKISSFKQPGFYDPVSVMNEYFFKENPGYSFCSATIFRTDLVLELGGFLAELGSYCDTFIARGLALKNGMIYLAFPCVVWTINEKSLSGSTSNDNIKLFQIIKNCSKLMSTNEYKEFFPDEYIKWWQFYYEHLTLISSLVNSLKRLQTDENLNLFPKIRNSSRFKKILIKLVIKIEILFLKIQYVLCDRLLLK